MQVKNHHRFTVAPMMGYSHRHFIAFMRMMSRECLLFTEMLPANGIVANHQKLCDWAVADLPITVQIGGSDAALLADAAKIIADYGATAVNLNMGCPSPKVKKGAFGACLMLQPEKSAELVAKMASASSVPVNVKIRIGVDAQDDEEALHHLIALLVEAGSNHIYLHARKAILKGLSPKQNRTIPPLRYDVALRVKQAFPSVPLIVNGGIETMEAVQEKLQLYDGVMVGRAAINRPYDFASIDKDIFAGTQNIASRCDIFTQYHAYMSAIIAQQPASDTASQTAGIYHYLCQPLFNLAHGKAGAKKWRMAVTGLLQKPEKLCDRVFITKMRDLLIEIDQQ